MADPQTPTLEKPLVAERPPFVSLLPRLSAFVIDVVLIYFVGYTLEMALRGSLQSLGSFFTPLSAMGTFAYFWLANGPVGQGATLGKSILNLHVVAADGSPLDYKASFRRTLLQLPTIYVIGFHSFADLVHLPTRISFYAGGLISSAEQTIYLVLLYAVFAHPWNRSLHDLWAGSFVTPDPTPSSFRERLDGAVEGDLAERLDQFRRQSRILLVFVVVISVGMWMASIPAERDLLQMRLWSEQIAPEVAIDGYEFEGAVGLAPESWRQFSRMVLGEPVEPAPEPLANRSEPAVAPTPTPTSEARPATPPTPEGSSASAVLFRYTKRRGATERSEMENDALLDQIDRLRVVGPDLFTSKIRETDPEYIAPQRIAAMFEDRLRFVIFSLGKPRRWVAHGPIDPAEGLLRYEWIEIEENSRGPAAPTPIQTP